MALWKRRKGKLKKRTATVNIPATEAYKMSDDIWVFRALSNDPSLLEEMRVALANEFFGRPQTVFLVPKNIELLEVVVVEEESAGE